MTTDLPAPRYALFQTSLGSDPAIVVVNSAARSLEHRERFPWHLSIVIDCQELGERGMPTVEENRLLYQLEDTIAETLLLKDNAVFLARQTCRGQRELSYRIKAPEEANRWLALLVSRTNPRHWQYRMEHDEEWGLATRFMSLFEQATP